jgi:hypothetical protein
MKIPGLRHAARALVGVLGLAAGTVDAGTLAASGPSEAFAVSLGGGRGTGHDAISALVGMRYRRGRLLVSAVYTEVGRIAIFGPEDNDRGLAVLAGRHYRRGPLSLSASGGFAYVHHFRAGPAIRCYGLFNCDYGSSSEDDFGFPVEVRAVVSAPWFGVGLTAFASLDGSGAGAHGGLAVTLEIGKLR